MTDIDDGAAKARLREIAAASKASLDARMRQVTELNEQARATAEREEAEVKAALARKAEAEAKRAAPEPAAPAAPPRPKRTLSLGGAEFAEERAARQGTEPGRKPAGAGPVESARFGAVPPPSGGAQAVPPGAPSAEPPPGPSDEAAKPRRTLRLGAREDQEEEPRPAKKPARPRPASGDDDMSGRTWLR